MTFYERVVDLIEAKEMEKLKDYVNQMDLDKVINLLMELENGQKVIAFRLLSKDFAIEVFEKLDRITQDKLVENFAENELMEIVGGLEYDDRARLLDELPAKVTKRILNHFQESERKIVDDLLGYAPETAGRLMNPEYISLKKNLTVEEAMAKLKKLEISSDTANTIYITDSERKLEGAIALRVLVMADSDKKLDSLMYGGVPHVYTFTDQEEAARLLKQQDLLAVPVVDKEKRLVGVLTFDDAMDILEEEATEDIFDKAGFSSFGDKEADRSKTLIAGSILDVWKVRLPFLLITLAGGVAAGFIIEGFEESLEAITALAFFIPVIMDMGGNVGTQSSTIFARAFVLGQINVKRFFHHLFREIRVGFSIGAILGVATGLIALAWQGEPALGLVVGLSLIITLTLASTLGFVIPYALIKMGFDQAAGSDPIITTTKDITGLLIYFYLASVFLTHLMQDINDIILI